MSWIRIVEASLVCAAVVMAWKYYSCTVSLNQCVQSAQEKQIAAQEYARSATEQEVAAISKEAQTVVENKEAWHEESRTVYARDGGELDAARLQQLQRLFTAAREHTTSTTGHRVEPTLPDTGPAG